MFSNRVSHFFNLKGPSVTIDTGCSASLAALHLAIQSIRNGESEISIVGASALMLNPNMFIVLCRIGVLSPEGKSFSLDARADGYGRGEGTAALILKTLSAAERDGDFIHAVLRESSMNQDGRTATITSPSGDVQQELIRECYRKAGLEMSSTCYVEGHFTGTIADVIEAEAVASTIAEARAPLPLYVGTIKPNIGHTEPVSGIASIIKVALMLRHKLIPPNAHFETPNPRIPFSRWNLHVPISLLSCPDDVLRASVNNFGYGGTNVHVIMEAYHNEKNRAHTNVVNSTCKDGVQARIAPSYVYVVSSKEESGTQAMSQALAKHIKTAEGNDSYAPALAYTLAERRSRFPYTAAVRARSLDQLAARFEDPHIRIRKATTDRCRVGFVFNGQGGQWHAMGRGLINTYPKYREAMQRADRILQHRYSASWSLMEEMMRDEATSRIHEISLSPVISVALQLCLVDLLRAWNCFPSAVVSHSSGEIAAAYAACVVSFEEALGIAYHRGQLSEKYQNIHALHGGMLAVRLGVEEVEEYIAEVPEAADDRVVRRLSSQSLGSQSHESCLVFTSASKHGGSVSHRCSTRGWTAGYTVRTDPANVTRIDASISIVLAAIHRSSRQYARRCMWTGYGGLSPDTRPGQPDTQTSANAPARHAFLRLEPPIEISSRAKDSCRSSSSQVPVARTPRFAGTWLQSSATDFQEHPAR